MEKYVVEFAFDLVIDNDSEANATLDFIREMIEEKVGPVDYADWRTIGKIEDEKFIHV